MESTNFRLDRQNSKFGETHKVQLKILGVTVSERVNFERVLQRAKSSQIYTSTKPV
jgi:hypothetical protein